MVSLQAIVLFATATVGQQGPVLLEFTSSSCGPCQRMRPVIQQLKTAGYPIQEVDYEQRNDLAQQFRITEVPTFVLVNNGRVVARRSGACSQQQLASMFAVLKPAATENVAQRGTINRGPILPNPNPPVLSPPPLEPPPLEPPRQTAPSGSVALASDTRAGFNAAAFPSPQQHHQPRPTAPSQFQPQAQSQPLARPQATPRHVSQTHTTQPPPATQFTSTTMPVSGVAAEKAAMHATVRIEVKDAGGASFATGTIIDRHGDEFLVLTCGHVFKSSKGKGQILVDTFYPGGGQDIAGQLVAWEVEDRDVGLISFRASGPATPQVAKLPTQKKYRKGDLVFSIGCDRGADPTLQMTKITSIDRYHGASNIEIAGQPVDGRSGGGLFTSQGELIGVCNAADPTDDEGIYAALPAVQKHLLAFGMRHLVTGEAPIERSTSQPQPSPSPTTPAAGPDTTIASSMPARAFADVPPIRNASRNPSRHNAASATGKTEVIVVIRDGDGAERVMTIRQPSRELIQQMQHESTQSQPRSNSPIMSAGRMTPIIRGQSVR